jgi:flavin-dependent dehydrogenase
LRNAERLGAKVIEEVGVTAVEDIETDVCVVRYRDMRDGTEGSIRASYVVDASGQAAVVARQLGIRVFDDALRFSSFWGYYHGGR